MLYTHDVCDMATMFHWCCCVITDTRLQQLVSQFTKSLPPKLIINIKHLKVLESVGQGMHVHDCMEVYTANQSTFYYVYIQIHMYCFTGEYGIVYKAQLVRGGLPQLVAVKTVKGKACCM